MHNISIETETFERLQSHAQPLVDTVDAVVNRALDAMEHSMVKGGHENTVRIEREVDPDSLPDLKHTKVITAKLADEDIARPNWNRLLDRMIVRTMLEVGDLDELRRRCPANMVRGRKSVEGYHHLPEVDISVQGLSANEACAALTVTGRGLGIGMEIVFLWREKEGSVYPGERGRLQVLARQAGT